MAKNTKKSTISIKILWGLPGSGKTTYAKIQPLATVIDVDKEYETKAIQGTALVNRVVNLIGRYPNNTTIIDSLVTTNKVAKKLIEAINRSLEDRYDIEYHVVYWDKDVETCIFNDSGRRKLSSVNTIKNLEFETPDSEFLGIPKINIVKKKVVKKSSDRIWIDSISNSKDGMLRSSSWTLGGTSGNCYNDEKYPISADPTPEFNEFDSLLESICPHISFLQYKKLYRESVTTEQNYHSDYYGGGHTDAFYVCDLKKLHTLLLGMNLVKE